MAKRSRKRARQDERRQARDDEAFAALAAAQGLDEELDRFLSGPSPAAGVAWRTECEHYRSRTLPSGDVVPRCRVDAAGPFGCPEGCPRFEGRGSLGAGAG